MTLAGATPHRPGPHNADYHELERLLRTRGLLGPEPMFHTRTFILVLACVSASIASLLYIHSMGTLLAGAAFSGFASVRCGMLMHDACHQDVYRRRWMTNFIRFVSGNLLIGLSAGWWTFEHSRHHANPNVPGWDPDIGVPHLAFSPEQAARKGPIGGWVVRHQAPLFFPLFALQSVYLRWVSNKWLLTRRSRYRRLEAALVVLHAVLYPAIVFSVLPVSWGFIFIGSHQIVFGLYAGSIFAPGHKGAPLATKEQQADYLSFQVKTTRNIRSTRLTDFWYSGLHYQVEHHVFPRMSRNRFAEARPIIREFCNARGIEVEEVTALRTYRVILQHLRQVSAQAQRRVI